MKIGYNYSATFITAENFPLSRGKVNCETLGEKKRKVKITILWVVRNVMCLPAPCIPASQGSSEITNENVHVAENSGEKNSANTDRKSVV